MSGYIRQKRWRGFRKSVLACKGGFLGFIEFIAFLASNSKNPMSPMSPMSPKRPFRLHAVLRYRQQVEEQLGGECTRLMQAVAEAEKKRFLQQQQWEGCLQVLRGKQQSGLPAAELCTYGVFLERLSAEMAHQAQVIATLRRATEEARRCLEQAMKDRKILENLQEKAKMQERKEARRDAEQTLAEIALRRFTF